MNPFICLQASCQAFILAVPICAAELKKEVGGLQQALAEQKQASKEAQATAHAAQQQTQEAHHLTDQLRQAVQAKESALASIKVPGIAPPFLASIFVSSSTPNCSRLLVCMSRSCLLSPSMPFSAVLRNSFVW